ncbi:MAG: nucleoside-diphosphate kinase [bacterium]
MERTFVMIKPDGVARALAGRIIGVFEQKGLTLRAMKLMRVTQETAERHYAEHVGKPFYPGLVSYIQSGPVVAMCWEGPNAVAQVRSLVGATHPKDAAPGTIRGDFALDISNNLVHASDSPATAERELSVYFTAADYVEGDIRCDAGWLTGR